MPTPRLWILGPCILIAGSLFGDDAVRTRLIGTWSDAASGDTASTVWSLEDKGDAIRITHVRDGQKVQDLECNTMGRECESKGSGRSTKVSMWFNGPKLVQMETHGTDVIKRRFAVLEKGDVMELEVIPIVPAGKTEVVQLRRIAKPHDSK